MDMPLLRTKLYMPPPRPELVSRVRLIDRLNENLLQRDAFTRKLTLVSAPAGFGKTTMVCDWLKQTNLQAAWLSLDEADNDLGRFLLYMITALQTIVPDLGRQVLAELNPPLPPMKLLITALINDVMDVSVPILLVLDDYHMIELPAIDQALIFLLDHLPVSMHLVMTTRTDPSLPLSRLRARSQITELRTADLRFTVDEAAIFLNRITGLHFFADDVSALENRTEGWIAGLQLAALSIQNDISDSNSGDVQAFINTFTGSNRYVIDYLTDEVLRQRPVGTQDFLLQTAILTRLSGSLCDAVTGQSNGQTMLETLEAANLFLIPLDQIRGWYRYHHLFADLLHERLQRQRPEQVKQLHQNASQWYAEQAAVHNETAFIAEALRHALAAADFAQAVQVVETHARFALMTGQVNLLIDWLAQLPDEFIRHSPRLCLGQAWIMYFTQRPQELEQWLQQVEVLIDTDMFEASSEATAYQGEVSNLRAWVARNQGDFQRAIPLFEQALTLLPEANTSTRGLAHLFLASALTDVGQMDAGMQHCQAGIELCKQAGNIAAAMGGTASMAGWQVKCGQLLQATATLQQALNWAEQMGQQQQRSMAEIYVQLAHIAYEQNALETAETYLAQATNLLEDGLTASVLSVSNQLHLTQLQLAQEKIEESQQSLKIAESWMEHWQGNPSQDLFARHIRLHLKSPIPNWSTIKDWVQQLEPQLDPFPITFEQELQHIVLAEVYQMLGESESQDAYFAKAFTLLEALLQRAETGERWGSVIEISVLQALVLARQGEMASGLKVLERALTLAEPETYVRTFVDLGQPMATLLRQASNQGIRPAYTAQLLTAFSDKTEAVVTPSDTSNPTPLIEPLSERELDVLSLLPTDLTTPEIAETLIVATSTVRSHVKSIYGKLGVHSRHEAVDRARELKLL